jgi:hypothetical protein
MGLESPQVYEKLDGILITLYWYKERWMIDQWDTNLEAGNYGNEKECNCLAAKVYVICLNLSASNTEVS